MACELPWSHGPRRDDEHPDIPLDPSSRYRGDETDEIAAEVLSCSSAKVRRQAGGILSQAWFHAGRLWIAYSRDRTWYGRHPTLTYNGVVPIIDALVDEGWLESFSPRHSARGFQSVLSAGPRLRERFARDGETRTLKPFRRQDLMANRSASMVGGCTWERPGWVEEPPMVVVSRRRGGDVLTWGSPSSRIRPVERGLRRLNQALLQVDIRVLAPTTPDGFIDFETDEGRVVRVNVWARLLHASYIALGQDRWRYGGRLYGGFWQSIPRWARLGLRPNGDVAGERRPDDLVLLHIDGERTAESDFSCLHPRLLYAAAGGELTGDAYDVPGFDRGHAKIALNALVNATSVRRAIAALTDRRACSASPGLPHDDARRLVELLLERHRRIEPLLGRDAGIVLQNVDGRMALDIALTLFEEGVPVLPVHDSFVCRECDLRRVEEVMSDRLEQEQRRLRRDGLPLPR